jgi:hypothetical protein
MAAHFWSNNEKYLFVRGKVLPRHQHLALFFVKVLDKVLSRKRKKK